MQTHSMETVDYLAEKLILVESMSLLKHNLFSIYG